MKLYKKNFKIWQNEIFLLPTFKIVINNPIYVFKNLSVEFHFLIFHARLMWAEIDG